MKPKESMTAPVPRIALGLAVGMATVLVMRPFKASAQQRDANSGGPTTQSSGQTSGQSFGRRGGAPIDFQQAQLNRMKELLGPTEEEWKVLEPRLRKVQDLLRDSGARNAIGSARGRRGGFGGSGPTDSPPTPVQQAARELQESLASKDVGSDEVKNKLAALREARAKSQVELSKAQDQLREVLTARQEAMLVMAGILN